MNYKPLPTEVLANALQDRVHPSSGGLKDQRPVRRYGSRKPGTNPRTGEPLVPWQEVQVLDPDMRPLDTLEVAVQIETSEGTRMQAFKVRAWADLQPEAVAAVACVTARTLGFTVVLS